MGKRNKNKFKRREVKGTERLQSRATQPKKSTDHNKPVFSLEFLEKTHCISGCDSEVKTAFVDKLHQLAQKSWLELKLAPRKGLGYGKIARQSMRVPIPQHISEDNTIIRFRFYGKAPIVGYRIEQVFHVVWIDIKYDVYDHGS